MEDIQTYSFTVKSQIHDYSVEFINDLKYTLKIELKDGDFIIIDKKVQEIYKNDLKESLENHDFIDLDANETVKSYQGVNSIIEKLINKGFKKNHRLIAIGGGITQDVTAFISSILYEVYHGFFPTSLLAQGDSCIGSKTSINFNKFKNLVGGFFPPNKILIYPNFVDSLDTEELKSGMGEMLHYFIVSGEEDFKFYKNNFKEAFSNKNVLTKIIFRSLKIKKEYIEKDEFDKNIRQVFNYGHSFGHAIESLTNYNIPHGIAVSFGMDIANYISVRLGLIEKNIRREILDVTSYIWNGYSINNLNIDDFVVALSKDKKNVDNKLGLILNKGYGKIFKKFIDNDDNFKNLLNQYLIQKPKT